MNIFILSTDIDKCAEYHVDKHVTKMILEAAQMLATTVWVDKLIGYVPRKLDSAELAIIRAEMVMLPSIGERTFLRYKAAHLNHPCSIWARTSYDNYQWLQVYANALNEEAQYRGYKPHASCAEVNSMPEPFRLKSIGLTPFAQAMPDEYKSDDAVTAYRTYYKNDKADIATWKRRQQPEWF